MLLLPGSLSETNKQAYTYTQLEQENTLLKLSLAEARSIANDKVM